MPNLGEYGLIFDLVAAILAALIGGGLAHRLRQPVIVGYMLAGVAIAPLIPDPVEGLRRVHVMAEIGVAFLMFALGAEFSLAQLRSVRNVAVFGGAAQILLTIGLGTLVGPLLNLDLTSSVYFGSLIALSSTMVALKILMGRGELDSLHGRLAVGFLIVQDLSVVPMMVILPALAEPQADLAISLAVAMGKAALLLAATYYLGTLIVPWVLARVAGTRSRELFLLTIVSLALGTALATYLFGFSLAFGAFIAGLVVSESEFSHQILAEVLPLRDIFATLFFVSVGMLLDPMFLMQNLPTIALVALAIVLGKFLISLVFPLLFGYSGKIAVYTSLALVQIGEFSFVLAKLGVDRGLITEHLYSLTLSGALVTILLAPLAMYLAPRILEALRITPGLGPIFQDRPEVHADRPLESLSQHTVILGFGRVGRELGEALDRRGFKYLAVEYNPHIIANLRRKGIRCIYGDASNIEVLSRTNLTRAKVLAVTLPDFPSAEVAVRNAKRLNPRLDVIVRAHDEEYFRGLRGAGAISIVRPEFETALEFIRHAMHRYGVSGPEIQAMLASRRAEYAQRLKEAD
ncbi:MAG: cation:proton antiporter [Chloroflexi bacterium]|nr:cation:proton antiporter [Chloroflexota bacterium]